MYHCCRLMGVGPGSASMKAAAAHGTRKTASAPWFPYFMMLQALVIKTNAHLQELGHEVRQCCGSGRVVRRGRRQHERCSRARHPESSVHLVPQPQAVLLRCQCRRLRES